MTDHNEDCGCNGGHEESRTEFRNEIISILESLEEDGGVVVIDRERATTTLAQQYVHATQMARAITCLQVVELLCESLPPEPISYANVAHLAGTLAMQLAMIDIRSLAVNDAGTAFEYEVRPELDSGVEGAPYVPLPEIQRAALLSRVVRAQQEAQEIDATGTADAATSLLEHLFGKS